LNFKKYFSLPENEIYFNCAGQGPLSNAAAVAVSESLRDKQNPRLMNMCYGSTRADACRAALAGFIDFQPENIALADSTSWGINLLTRGLELTSGDEVIMFEGQFPSNAAPWEFLVKDGIRIVKVPSKDFCADVKAFKAHLSKSTRVACLEWVHWISGDKIPLRELIDICHQQNILVVVDVTQGVGATPFSMKEFPADAVCCSGYKWLASPYGSGFFALNNSMIERLEACSVNWLCLESVLQGNISKYELDLCRTARRFDVFSHMGYLNIDGLTASATMLKELNVEEIFKFSYGLHEQLKADVDPKKYRLLNVGQKERQSLISTFEILTDAQKLSLKFEERKISATFRDGNLRLSPFCYNDSDQVKEITNIMNQN
jgi:selenocysteine lyase/cysteine desulfurase